MNFLIQQENISTKAKSMIQIIWNQKERFKSKVMELTSVSKYRNCWKIIQIIHIAIQKNMQENKELLQQLQARSTEVDSLRSDNLQLFQKIKYLQSYGRDNSSKLESGESNKEVEQKYSQLYEESVVNPFVLFNRKVCVLALI